MFLSYNNCLFIASVLSILVALYIPYRAYRQYKAGEYSLILYDRLKQVREGKKIMDAFLLLLEGTCSLLRNNPDQLFEFFKIGRYSIERVAIQYGCLFPEKEFATLLDRYGYEEIPLPQGLPGDLQLVRKQAQ